MATTRFSTSNAADVDKHAAWLSTGSPEQGKVFAAQAEPEFEANTTTIWIEQLRIVFGWYGAQSISRSVAKIKDQPLGSLLVGLSGTMITEGNLYRVGPKELLFLDYAQPFTHRSSAGSLVTISIPRSVSAANGIDPLTLHGRVVQKHDASLLRGLMAEIEQMPDLASDQAAHVSAAVLNLVAAAAIKSAPFSGLKARETSNALKTRAEQIIEAGASDLRVDVPFLCRTLAISRSTLYNLYREDGGVLRRIRRERLRAAQLALRSTDKGIGQIGIGLGFHDAAHFARAFREEFGLSPTAWRASQ